MNNLTWTIKYEPKKLDDMILHPAVKNRLKSVLRNPQNVILFGSTGIGKGTFTNIFINETDCDLMWKNASQETGIKMIREDIDTFANTANLKTWFGIHGLSGQQPKDEYKHLKAVVFNEVENLSPEAQAALRELMERVETRCKFIFMTNGMGKIDDAIISRCQLVEFKSPPVEEIIKFIENMLEQEGVNYEGGLIAESVQRYYPDIRKTIKEIQSCCNEHELVGDDSFTIDETVDRVLLDLRLYMAYYRKDRKEMYNQIKDMLNLPVSSRQFYYLLSGKNLNKVSKERKAEVVKCIQANISVKNWVNDYMKQV
jgi:DNA polymerase III delta prime subunit